MTVETVRQPSRDLPPSKRPKGSISEAEASVPFWKRGLDILLAVPALIVLSPVFAVCALAIRLDSSGPALFRQTRVGRGGQPFTLFKFRTMHVGTPNLSTREMQQQGKSPITRCGAFLRRFSLDELPQLWNVLRGEMSLVGPRPALPSQIVVNSLRQQAGVEELLPGITGWAQINGRDEISDDAKVAFDAYYRENQSLGLDMKILLCTALPVLTGRGNR
jgi:lipopolysaccharide/colanic/teichoic acid biosynthesis glycosyltransferase